MSKFMLFLVPGVFSALILMFVNTLFFPESLREDEIFDRIMSLCYLACIIIPCVIYFIKMPPGVNNKP